VVRGETHIFDGRWHHLAVVVDGRELRMYLDEKLDGRSVSDEPYPIDPSRSDLFIAGVDGKPNRFVDGMLDDIRLYRVPLDEDAIAELADVDANSASSRWQDMLPRIDPKRDTLTGMWRKVDGELEQYGDEYVNRFVKLPIVLRRSYELELDFTRINGDNSVNILLPVGDRGIHLMLGSHTGEGGLAGLSIIKGEAIVSEKNPTRRENFLLEDGRCYGLRVRVTTIHGRASVEVELDGEAFTS
jgi:hypothetical protein